MIQDSDPEIYTFIQDSTSTVSTVGQRLGHSTPSNGCLVRLDARGAAPVAHTMIRLPQPSQQRPPPQRSASSPSQLAGAGRWQLPQPQQQAQTQQTQQQQQQQQPLQPPPRVAEDEAALNPVMAQFAQTNAAKLLAGQSTGRVSARTAARQERLRQREQIMRRSGQHQAEEQAADAAQQPGEDQQGTLRRAAGATKNALNRGAQLASRRLSPLELALQPTAEDLLTPQEAPNQLQSDVPVLPEYMVAKIKEIGPRSGSSIESEHHRGHRKHSKEGLLRMRLSGQSVAKLFWFELRAPKLLWRTPPSGGKRYADGELRGRMIMPDLVEQVSHDRGSAEVIIHCGGAQRMHLMAVNDEQALQWHKVLKRAAFAPPPTQRSGKALWAYLRPRLKLVVAMQEQWGNVHMLYGKASSLFEATALPPTVRDPDSNFSGFWDICQLFLLLYVSFTVPYRTCFDLETELWSFAFLFDMLVDIYCKPSLPPFRTQRNATQRSTHMSSSSIGSVCA
jgi:hypothetical protein